MSEKSNFNFIPIIIIALAKGLSKCDFDSFNKKIKSSNHIIQNTKDMPDWFIPLINRVVKEGDDVTAKLGTVEREIVHTKKIGKGEEVTVYQNLDTGNVRVEYGPFHPPCSRQDESPPYGQATAREYLSYSRS